MTYDPKLHDRKNLRLANYDYSSKGAYCITICCSEQQCLFGEVHNGAENKAPQLRLNQFGQIALNFWQELPA